MNYNKRRSFLHRHIRVQPKIRSRPRSGENNRKFSRFYTFTDCNNQEKFVCKSFFLKTFGYTSDKILTSTLAATPPGTLIPQADKRGTHNPANKMPDETCQLIEQHIRSYNPCISHYRREHAPNRLYLPSAVTVTSIHKDFISKHQVKVCYDTYRKEIDKMNKLCQTGRGGMRTVPSV